jgi:RimJ/RimL family protein N-acetyltransferase
MPGLILRDAVNSDARSLWIWRNDPSTVEASLSGSQVSWEDHVRWYSQVLRDPQRKVFVMEIDDEPAGMVRLDSLDEDTYEISINVSPLHRGRGLGTSALLLALRWFQEVAGGQTVLARVLKTNSRSLRAFRAAGFYEASLCDGVVEMIFKVQCD